MHTRQSTLFLLKRNGLQIELTNIGVSLWTGVVGVRGGLAKRLAKIPPVLFRETSREDCVLVMGGGEVGSLIVFVRRTVGLVDMNPLLGSRADVLLLSFGASPLRNDADPDPESGVFAVRLEEFPSSLLFLVEDLRIVVCSAAALALGRPYTYSSSISAATSLLFDLRVPSRLSSRGASFTRSRRGSWAIRSWLRRRSVSGWE
jgi:hypothetical protein